MHPTDLLSQLEEPKFLRLFRYLVELRDPVLYQDNLHLPAVARDLPDAELIVKTIGKVSSLSSWAMTWAFQIAHLPTWLRDDACLIELFIERRLKAAFNNLRETPNPISFLHGEPTHDTTRWSQYPIPLDIDYYLFTNAQLDCSQDALRRFSIRASELFGNVTGVPPERHPRFGFGTPQTIFGNSHGSSLVEKFVVDLLNMPSSYYFVAREGRISVIPVTEHGGFFATRETGRTEPATNGISAVVSSALCAYGSSLKGLADLEALINSPKTKECDLQCFFRLHPHFLFALNEKYCEIKSHVCLVEENRNRHVPDFMARIEDSFIWDVIELKRPQHYLTRTEKIEQPSSIAARGIAELVRYRDFFASRDNRNRVAQIFGTAPYEPALVLVIGRGRATDRYEWHTTRPGLPHVQVVSYDFLFERAQQCSDYLRKPRHGARQPS